MMNPQIDSSQTVAHNILIVDEDQKYVREMIATLSYAGFACQGCTTVETALAAAEARRPDLILTSLDVQGVPGMEICRHVRENGHPIDLPVMLLSPTQMPDTIRRRDDAHRTYYVRRHIKGSVLLELIDKVLPASDVVNPD